jgi:hypothetical protein
MRTRAELVQPRGPRANHRAGMTRRGGAGSPRGARTGRSLSRSQHACSKPLVAARSHSGSCPACSAGTREVTKHY